MFDWDSILEDIALEDGELLIDHGFIVGFLAPYFPDMDPSELEATLTEVISVDLAKPRA